jgi:hypothetical protein
VRQTILLWAKMCMAHVPLLVRGLPLKRETEQIQQFHYDQVCINVYRKMAEVITSTKRVDMYCRVIR